MALLSLLAPVADTFGVSRSQEEEDASGRRDDDDARGVWRAVRCVVVLMLAAFLLSDSPARMHEARKAAEARRRGLPSPVCLPESYIDVSKDADRELAMQPLGAVARRSVYCDSAATTGVGGGAWFRFDDGSDVLPTQPPRSTGAACAASAVGWVSGWPGEFDVPPPDDYARPGSFPGDGPQYGPQYWACFEGSGSTTAAVPGGVDASMMRWEPGVLWEAWRMRGNRVQALYTDPRFLEGRPTARRLVAPSSSSASEPARGSVTQQSLLFVDEAPSRDVIAGCCNFPSAESEPDLLAMCSDLCDGDPFCCFWYTNWLEHDGDHKSGRRCCLKAAYERTGGLRATNGGGTTSQYWQLLSRSWRNQTLSLLVPPNLGAAWLQPQDMQDGLPYLYNYGRQDAHGERIEADGVGTRMRTYFRAPHDGTFTMTIRCVGTCELWMMVEQHDEEEDEGPEETPPPPQQEQEGGRLALRKIASPPVPEGGNDDKPPPMFELGLGVSAPIRCIAGRRYLLVAVAAQLFPASDALSVSVEATVPSVPIAQLGTAAAEAADRSLFFVSSRELQLQPPPPPPQHAGGDGADGRASAASASASILTCAVAAKIAALNCGTFMLWQLPDAPGCDEQHQHQYQQQQPRGGAASNAFCTTTSDGLFDPARARGERGATAGDGEVL